MNLLVFNIRTDAEHPTQGVTTRWLNELAKHFDHIFVITMHKGRLDLHDNIDVYSVGGEVGNSRIRKAVNFYKLLFRILRRNDIHGCFTHMAVLFALLGGPIFVVKRIPMVTWYAHSVINPVMIGAYLLSSKVITASQDSFRIKSRKVNITGHGIDTNHYSKEKMNSNNTFLIGSVGRISRIKNYELLLHSLKLLINDGIDSFTVKLYGNIQTRDDEVYKSNLENLLKRLDLADKVDFPGPLTNKQVPEVMSSFDVFVNMLSKGGVGKAVLEAMSTKVPTLICTPAFNPYLTEEDRKLLVFRPNNPVSLKQKLKGIMKVPEEKRIELGKRLREMVIKEHSLNHLALDIKDTFCQVRKIRKFYKPAL